MLRALASATSDAQLRTLIEAVTKELGFRHFALIHHDDLRGKPPDKVKLLAYGQGVMTAHGFRAMAATLLNEMGIWNPDAIERQLAHMENNGVRRAYTRGQYWDERVRMMQHWSDYLDELRETACARMAPRLSENTSFIDADQVASQSS